MLDNRVGVLVVGLLLTPLTALVKYFRASGA
jgi:hypothetical protein